MRWTRRLAGGLILGAACVLPTAWAAPAALPEAAHFERTKFLIGLRQQGLFDLQAAFMQAFAAEPGSEQAWYQREAVLAQAAGADLAWEKRIELLARADALAAEAVQGEPDSPRSVLWQVDRAQVWMDQAARPLFEQLLFYGATPAIRRDLKQAASTAVKAYDEAVRGTETYQQRLTGGEGAELATRAEPLHMNSFALQRQLQFERSWLLLQQAMAMDRGDVDQGLLAGELLRSLQEQRLLDTSGEPSDLTAQALLLAAIASRLQNDWPGAEDYLRKTAEAYRALPSAAQVALGWVWMGLGVEQARLLLDQADYQRALALLGDLRRAVEQQAGTQPAAVQAARRLSVAMIEFEAMTRAADAAAAAGSRAEQTRYLTQRYESVAVLAGEFPDLRAVIYQIVADRMGRTSHVSQLPPFAKAARASRAIQDGQYAEALAAAQLLDQDVADRRGWLAEDAVMFQATALQQLGRRMPAAEMWLRFARDWPQDPRSTDALRTSLALMAQEREALNTPAGRQVFIEAAEQLLRQSPEVACRDWALPLAEALLLEGRFDRAAEVFQFVPRDGPQHVRAVRGRILAVAGKLRFAGESNERIRQDAEAVVAEAMEFSKQMAAGTDTQPASADVAGEVLLAAAQLAIDPLGEPDRALRILDDLQPKWKDDPARLAQLLGVRIQALQRKGDLGAAMQLVDGYLAGAPDAAGAMLSALLAGIQREIEQQQRGGQAEEAQKYVTLAVRLAEQLDTWTARHPGAVTAEQRYAIQYRLARTLLQAGQHEQALRILDALAKENAQRNQGQVRDAGVLEGQAQALLALNRYSEARDTYMRIWRMAEVNSPIWWQALLGSLQAAAELDEDPERIQKVIRQHKTLYPGMGGRDLERQFDELSQRMIRRMQQRQAQQARSAEQ